MVRSQQLQVSKLFVQPTSLIDEFCTTEMAGPLLRKYECHTRTGGFDFKILELIRLNDFPATGKHTGAPKAFTFLARFRLFRHFAIGLRLISISQRRTSLFTSVSKVVLQLVIVIPVPLCFNHFKGWVIDTTFSLSPF
jgi:hypothetical protein